MLVKKGKPKLWTMLMLGMYVAEHFLMWPEDEEKRNGLSKFGMCQVQKRIISTHKPERSFLEQFSCPAVRSRVNWQKAAAVLLRGGGK